MKYWEGIGRRKTSVARVRIYKAKLASTINDKKIEEIFTDPLDRAYITEPLRLTKHDSLSYTIKVKGGGLTGWKDSIRLGFARALIKLEPELKPILRKAGMLTRDPRTVERKKAGLKKARKAPRFSKR